MLQASRLAHGVARAEQAEGQDARRRCCRRRRACWQQIIWACCSLLECSCKPCSLVPSTSHTWQRLVGALGGLEVAASSAASFPTCASLSASICHRQEYLEHTIDKKDKTGQRARATETGRQTGGRAAAGVKNLFNFSQRLAFGVRRDDGSLRLAFQLLAFPSTLRLHLSAMQGAPQQASKLQESSTARRVSDASARAHRAAAPPTCSISFLQACSRDCTPCCRSLWALRTSDANVLRTLHTLFPAGPNQSVAPSHT